ncbi:conserved hypothetical protein [Rhodoferax ferrireducens T118]|uniref:ChrB C-terminal domain-containing protein n=1 Tax=Albidiferax ferrireducens (strain ATCC BAA-621 / DSM 15236 / T118) TaxID=338969 RepID=Q21VN7_ALBFT|nr:conserved hypothetical protein [Rhodoferax ferrireducens T118]
MQQKWISRKRPKIDRIAFPWLIRKFIDSDAEFLSVADSEGRKIAADTGATPYDITDRQLLMSMSALEKAVRQTLCQECVFRSQSTFSEPDRQN